MFASLSSLLSPPPPSPDILSPPPAIPVVDPPRKKEKEKKEKHANEAFIIVRPPPSKSTQPLSLQVQLVPPQSRNDKPVQALDSSPEDLSTDLKRIHSNRSETESNYSGYTSTASVSSFASNSTNSSGRRMIIPLYNLNVHSVMPTTILDAGTDAKVAKFAKRGLEVIGLAFLEPTEVRPSAPANGSASVSARPSLDDSPRDLGSTPGLSPSCHTISPGSTNTSQSTVKALADHSLQPTINLILAPPLAPPDLPPQPSTRMLFTRMFKRKDAASPLSIAVPLPTPQPSLFCNSARRSEDAPVSQLDIPRQCDPWPSTLLTSTTTVSQAAVLGIHSTLYPPLSNPKCRPIKYIWVVRKWLKGTDTGILNGMMGKLSIGARDAKAANTPHIEVRFEWSRGQKKGSSRKSRADKSLNARESQSPARPRTTSNPLPRFASQMLGPDPHDPRSSIISHNSSGSDTATSSSAHQHAEECGEESDPEDSETPWTCTVAVQRLAQSPPRHQNGAREPVIRLKVATLAPTPHHPKVVGLLKMPFPLPDIELEHPVVRRRVVTTQGISKTTTPNAGDFVLTAEEIKDTVSCTSLWLVVREAFGGVGREQKKGKS
ncbi:hypothetical protein J3R82DRAFT_8927 [Butyriboletus roseoflavus]|nr:hypothetical protein J3R82DRAFT_8927 [Butyriboletus roseoflavus]